MRVILFIWKILLLIGTVLGTVVLCKFIYNLDIEVEDPRVVDTLQGIVFFAVAFFGVMLFTYRINDFIKFYTTYERNKKH